MAAACDLTADDRYLVVLPLFHANAQYYSFAAAIAVGASVALMPTFSASRFVDQAARHGATCASLFAGPIRMILARGGPASPGLPPLRLRHCWYAQNLTPAQYDTIAELARLPAAPAVRDDRDDPGRAHRRARRPALRHDGLRDTRVRGRARRRRDRRRRRAGHHAVRRLPRRSGHDGGVVPRRLVPHR